MLCMYNGWVTTQVITCLWGFWRKIAWIFFHGSGFPLAANARRQVVSCVTKASVCIIHSMPIIGTVYGKLRQSSVSKTTLHQWITLADSLWIYFIVVQIFLLDLNTPILVWCRASRTQHSLTMGIVRRQLHSLNGNTRNRSHFEPPYSPSNRRILTFTGCN